MNLKQYLQKAKKEKWAIGQFNFSTIEQLQGIMEAAKELNSPVILGTSEGEAKYLGIEEIAAFVKSFRKRLGVPAFLNLDHAKDFNLIKTAVDSGYDAIHFDGSSLNYEENMENTRKIADLCHKKGIVAEGELGMIKGESIISQEEISQIDDSELTPPEKVKEFFSKTKIDSLAVSIGNFHGIHKKEPEIDFKRLEEIEKLSSGFLVFHGGSGISAEDLQKAINIGVSKINFNTELRLAWRESLEKAFLESKEIKPYKILPLAKEAVKQKVKEKIIIVKSYDKANF